MCFANGTSHGPQVGGGLSVLPCSTLHGVTNIFMTLQLVSYGANGLRESKVELTMSLMTRFWNYTVFIQPYSIDYIPPSHDSVWEETTQGLGSQEMAIIGGHLGFYM